MSIQTRRKIASVLGLEQVRVDQSDYYNEQILIDADVGVSTAQFMYEKVVEEHLRFEGNFYYTFRIKHKGYLLYQAIKVSSNGSAKIYKNFKEGDK